MLEDIKNKIKSFMSKPNEESYDMEKDIELIVASQSTKTIISPVVTNSIELSLERKATPGKLTFKMIFDEKVQEGDQVSLKYRGQNVFLGYVFTRKLGKNNIVTVTAYDQLRYLKSKAYYVFKGKKASEIVQMIAADFKLTLGEIEDTKHVFEKRREDGTTLIDMIQGALSDTLRFTNKRYVIYDDYGKLTLKETESLKIKDLIFDNTSGKDFDFESSIDKETYNQVVLDYVNDKEKKLEKYQVFDSENITKWGLLQYFEKVNRSNATEAERRERANKMLKYYNQRTKTLKLKGIFGDVRIRGGSSFIVYMDVAEFKLANYMLVDKVTHKFGFKEYFMDLDLEGKIGKEEGHNGEIRTSTDTNDK